jgi:hypothetical protein
MKRIFLTAGMAFAVAVSVMAQNSYIVKTRDAKKTVAAASAGNGQSSENEEEQEATDFVSANFKYYSLCNWEEGMKFMVMPEKYDLIVNTFSDASTGKDVSSGRLRHKIMIYKGHTVAADGHARINFYCEDDKHDYYYQVPNGTFDDYCYGKMGVPTLAYLGDVDIARTKLMGAKLHTTATLYRKDTDYDGDGFQEVTVPKNEEVTVTAVGVGTRSYPVKIIVRDKNGDEFYQNVAMSKTNSGMRDDEFIMDNAKFLFKGSFELIDADVAATGEYAQYIGKKVHTKYATHMDDAQGQKVQVNRLSSFVIKKIKAQSNSKYVTMTLKGATSGAEYTKQVTFVNDNVAGDIDGYKEDYYSYLFGDGDVPGLKNLPPARRKLIQEGKVQNGFTKAEVRLAYGEPTKTATQSNGRADWVYNEEGSPRRIVQFSKAGRVIGVRKF